MARREDLVGQIIATECYGSVASKISIIYDVVYTVNPPSMISLQNFSLIDQGGIVNVTEAFAQRRLRELERPATTATLSILMSNDTCLCVPNDQAPPWIPKSNSLQSFLDISLCSSGQHQDGA